MIEITVPLVPPSINHYWIKDRGGNTYVTSDAKKFKEAVAVFGRNLFETGEHFSVKIDIYLGKKQKLDVDNGVKIVLDAVAEAGMMRDEDGNYQTDSHVVDLHVRKHRDRQNPRTEIKLQIVLDRE